MKTRKLNTYQVTMKGTKKNQTNDITVTVLGHNVSMAFNFAYTFFEKGQKDNLYGREETGFTTISDYIPEAKNLEHLAGKYKVHYSNINRQ